MGSSFAILRWSAVLVWMGGLGAYPLASHDRPWRVLLLTPNQGQHVSELPVCTARLQRQAVAVTSVVAASSGPARALLLLADLGWSANYAQVAGLASGVSRLNNLEMVVRHWPGDGSIWRKVDFGTELGWRYLITELPPVSDITENTKSDLREVLRTLRARSVEEPLVPSTAWHYGARTHVTLFLTPGWFRWSSDPAGNHVDLGSLFDVRFNTVAFPWVTAFPLSNSLDSAGLAEATGGSVLPTGDSLVTTLAAAIEQSSKGWFLTLNLPANTLNGKTPSRRLTLRCTLPGGVSFETKRLLSLPAVEELDRSDSPGMPIRISQPGLTVEQGCRTATQSNPSRWVTLRWPNLDRHTVPRTVLFAAIPRMTNGSAGRTQNEALREQPGPDASSTCVSLQPPAGSRSVEIFLADPDADRYWAALVPIE